MSDIEKSDAAGKTLEDLKGVGDAARQVGGQAMQAGTDALDQAKDVAQDAKKRAASIASAVGDKASSAAESQNAKAVHRSGEQLEGHQDFVAHLVERGAAELSSLAKTLRSNDLQSLLRDLGSLARRQPALFVGASMAAGFALTRVGRLAAAAPAHTEPAPEAKPPSAPVPSAASRIVPATEPGGTMEVVRERQ